MNRWDSVPFRGRAAPGWTILPADFNADGLTDLFLYNQSTGQWFNAVNRGTGFAYFGSTWSPGWRPYIMDLNGDGRSDVFLSNRSTGQWFRCISSAGGLSDFTYGRGQWSPGWSIYPLDFNGDGLPDLLLYNPNTGGWFRAMNNGLGFTYVGGTWSPGWKVYPGDFSGHGRTDDLFLYNESTGQWYIAHIVGNDFVYTAGQWDPGAWTIQVVDLDGDGRADLLLSLTTTTSTRVFKALNLGAGFLNVPNGFQQPTAVTSIFPVQIIVDDSNRDGRPDPLLYYLQTGQQWVQCVGFFGNWVRLFCIHSFRWISWMTDMTTGESLLLDDLEGAATAVRR